MSEKLTCYIIDDEYLAQEILEAYIAKVPFLELKGTFLSPLEAAGQLAQENPICFSSTSICRTWMG
ncbi:hypothetical protein [Mucilaginibacter sp. HD30]